MEKFDTCFFERYAKITLTEILGEQFATLENHDRPDLQSPDHKSIGIEVTRAMEECQQAQFMLLKEMAGVSPCEDDLREGKDPDGHLQHILDSGYAYGLEDGQYVGHLEYDYWAMAQPLRRILRNKIRKAGNGFYGKYDMLGLYVFSKDDLTDESVSQTCSYVTELQALPPEPYQGEMKEPSIVDRPERGGRYQVLYLSEISNLYVCELFDGYSHITRHPISKEQRQEFFMKAREKKNSSTALEV